MVLQHSININNSNPGDTMRISLITDGKKFMLLTSADDVNIFAELNCMRTANPRMLSCVCTAVLTSSLNTLRSFLMSEGVAMPKFDKWYSKDHANAMLLLVTHDFTGEGVCS